MVVAAGHRLSGQEGCRPAGVPRQQLGQPTDDPTRTIAAPGHPPVHPRDRGLGQGLAERLDHRNRAVHLGRRRLARRPVRLVVARRQQIRHLGHPRNIACAAPQLGPRAHPRLAIGAQHPHHVRSGAGEGLVRRPSQGGADRLIALEAHVVEGHRIQLTRQQPGGDRRDRQIEEHRRHAMSTRRRAAHHGGIGRDPSGGQLAPATCRSRQQRQRSGPARARCAASRHLAYGSKAQPSPPRSNRSAHGQICRSVGDTTALDPALG